MAVEWRPCSRCHGRRTERIKIGPEVKVVACRKCNGTGGKMVTVRDDKPARRPVCRKCRGKGCPKCNGTGYR